MALKLENIVLRNPAGYLPDLSPCLREARRHAAVHVKNVDGMHRNILKQTDVLTTGDLSKIDRWIDVLTK